MIMTSPKPFPGCNAPISVQPKMFIQVLSGRTGIVFFKDYWKREGEKSPTGDHIDLWNRDRLTSSIASWLRFSVGLPSIFPYYSDLSKSRQILFWPIA